jgi:hypothetical protein
MHKFECRNKKFTFRGQRERNKKNSAGTTVCIELFKYHIKILLDLGEMEFMSKTK